MATGFFCIGYFLYFISCMQLSTGEIAVELQLLPFFFDNSTDRADLGTQGAAGTVGLGDAGFLLFRIIAQGRTARREAFAAADAEILPDFIGRIGAGKFSRIEGRPFFRAQGYFVTMTTGSSVMEKAQSSVSFMTVRFWGLTVRTWRMPRSRTMGSISIA